MATETYELPRPGDVVILVMGLTGSGQSRFINQFQFDRSVKRTSPLNSRTERVKTYKCWDPEFETFWIIDTPGFTKALHSDVEILRDIAGWLKRACLEGIQVTGILYLNSSPRGISRPKRIDDLYLLIELCGEQALRRVILVTNFRDKVDATGEDTRQQELEDSQLFESVSINGSRIFRHTNGTATARQIVRHLLSIRTGHEPGTYLQIQKEMVDEGKELDQTRAGQSMVVSLALLREVSAEFRRKLKVELQSSLANSRRELSHHRHQKLEVEQVLDAALPGDSPHLKQMAVHSDSGYGTGGDFDEDGQTRKEALDSDRGRENTISLRAPSHFSTDADVRISRGSNYLESTAVDPDILQRMTPNDEDIGSRIGVTKLPPVLTAEKHLEACLLSNDELLTAFRQISQRPNVQDLCADIREHLKYYQIDLRAQACTRLENASASLLRGHWYRERIAKRMACKLTGSAEDEEEEQDDDEGDVRTRESLLDLEEWIRGNQGFSDPNEGGVLPADMQQDTPEDRPNDSPDDLLEAFSELDYVKRMEHFIFRGTPFKKLLERIQMQAVTPRYYSLRRTLMTLPKESISFYSIIQQSWPDKLRLRIAKASKVEWDWWPLPPAQEPLPTDHCRISWKCHCGRSHATDVPKAEAEKLSKLIDLRVSPLSDDHLCKGREKGRRSWRQFLRPRSSTFLPDVSGPDLSSTSSARNHAAQAQTSSTTSMNQASSTGKIPGASGSSARNSTPTMPTGRDRNATLFGNRLQQHAVQIGVSSNDLLLVLGVKGKKRCLDISQIDFKKNRIENDGQLVAQITNAYQSKRGWLRLWFSVYQFRFCSFRKFLKYRAERISSIQDGVPEHNPDYEYKSGSQTPPIERPPISQEEFEDSLYPCATPCHLWFWPWHECIGPLTQQRMYERLPKKRNFWDVKGATYSEAWGLESRYKASFVHMLAYHLLMVVGPFGFWGWWQSRHPDDMQGAAVPLTIVLALMSMFWSSIGLLRLPEEGTYQGPPTMSYVQSNLVLQRPSV
ncbi:uncharacterized protein Z519_11607 [Cladophialophora bantiana CBS 173.52]|uniref:G domain-containing protein n=1 Tax=Cladophialophora bantiana (strain ATCC 10958 / CBS 173.52 / CDC B-1940 / NIH 8579) TaxID=1442370 RepID=A0A0D2H2V1_CLAB1|nr:uncharacterized protein Z519_11607 [Cladophialophora bantiana CBS 173.52]KIW87633.1 hypothetical protein Z519_11607 [Cladophialophora bantiana CBS 173.52]